MSNNLTVPVIEEKKIQSARVTVKLNEKDFSFEVEEIDEVKSESYIYTNIELIEKKNDAKMASHLLLLLTMINNPHEDEEKQASQD